MGIKSIKLDSVPSTNSYLAELVRAGEIHDELAVTADYQEDGRGQGDHSWHSRRGENLLMSVLLFPEFLSASAQFQLSRMAALAICDLLKPFSVEPLIKWPNDILVSHRKIAGILLEHGIKGGSLSHSILGIGLNLNQSSFPVFPVKATSLSLESGLDFKPGVMAEKLLDRISVRYKRLREGNGAGLEREYQDRLYLANQPALFRTGNRDVHGVIRGVNTLGELLVEIEGRLKAFSHQEIRFVEQ